MKEVLDEDHRTVHDDAEVNRAHREQVRAHAAHAEIRKRGGQGERDDRGYDQRSTDREREGEEDERDQNRPLHQIVKHGMEGRIDEDRAVVKWRDPDPAGQEVGVQLVDALAKQRQDLRGVLAASHEHDSFDRVVVVVASDDALPRRVPLVHLSDVADEHRDALVLGHPRFRDVVDRREDAHAANDEQLAPALDVASRSIAARLSDGREHVVQGDAERRQTHRIRLHVDLLDEAPVGHDIRNARHPQELRSHDPLLERA